MNNITITINVGRTILTVSLVIILIAALWVLITDYQSSYTWILPLDTPRSMMGYWKSTIGIGIYDLGVRYANYSNTLVINGLVSHIYVDKVESGYAIVVAKGFNLYVLLVTTMVSFNAILIVIREKTSSQGNTILKALILVILATIPLISLIPYVSEGYTLGYRAYEYPVREYVFQELPYVQLPLGNVSGLGLYKYVYNITVTNVPGKSLVRVWFTPVNDSVLVPTLVYIEAGGGVVNSSKLLVSSNNEVYTAFYVNSLESESNYLKILVFSEKQLSSSKIGYYLLSFHDGKSQPGMLSLILPLIFTAVVTIYNIIYGRLWHSKSTAEK